MKIRQTDMNIAAAHEWVARTRDFVEGEFAVKRKGVHYLPQNSGDQPASSYDLMKKFTIFYPATARTQEGLTGLIFRKPPVLEGSGPIMDRVCSTITTSGDDINTFAYHVVNEQLTTNFTGLLVDMPEGDVDARMSPDQRVDADMRPFINLYSYENIKDRDYQTIKGRKTLVYVHLSDCDTEERELRLVDGEYWVHKREKVDGVWIDRKPFQPIRNNKPLDHIPFFLITTSKGNKIEPSVLSRVANLNLTHYRNEGLIAMSKLFQSAPQGYVFGVEWPIDPKTNEPFKPTVSPGTFWTNPNGKDVQIGYLEYDGKGLDDMRSDRDKIESMMAVIGVQMIAGEKIAAEAPETLAIRRASENSALATIANHVSRQIMAALNEVADWMGLPHVRFQLNTDFLPQPMTAAELQAHVSALQTGALSHETFFLALRDGDLINPTLTYDEERKRLLKDKEDGLTFGKTAEAKEVPAELPRNDNAAPLA